MIVQPETATASEPRVRVGSAVLIVDDDDRVLLGRRNKHPNFDRWVLPGGKIEYGETHEAAAIREAREELGVDVEILRLAGKGIYHIISPGEHRLIVYSVARKRAGDVTPASDISQARFFRKDELASLDITEVVASVLRDEGWLEN